MKQHRIVILSFTFQEDEKILKKPLSTKSQEKRIAARRLNGSLQWENY